MLFMSARLTCDVLSSSKQSAALRHHLATYIATLSWFIQLFDRIKRVLCCPQTECVNCSAGLTFDENKRIVIVSETAEEKQAKKAAEAAKKAASAAKKKARAAAAAASQSTD